MTGEGVDGERIASVALLAEIEELGPMPETESAEVQLFDELPGNLTYPDITPVLFECAEKALCKVADQKRSNIR